MEADSPRITYHQLPDGTTLIGIHPVEHKPTSELHPSISDDDDWSSAWGKPTEQQIAEEKQNNEMIERLSPKRVETSNFARKAMLYTAIGGTALIGVLTLFR